VLLVDVPIMLVIFFISGYFALPSLVRRGPARFLGDKFVRVGAPWLVGALLLAPPTAYLAYYSRAVPMSLPQFWASDFWTVAFQQSVYWFLGVLFALFALLALVYSSSERLRGARQQVARPGWRLFFGFWALMTLGMFLMNQFFPVDTWYTRAYLLVFQPLRVLLYFGYFGLGISAHLRGWFASEAFQSDLPSWASLWLLSGLLYLAHRLFLLPAEPMLPVQLVHAALFNTFCLSSLMACAAIFQRQANQPGRIWSTLSASAYGIYYLHPLILYPLAILFLPFPLPLIVKAPLVILLGIGLSWAASALLLRRLPLVRRAFA
jgi:hypothetical protein